MHPHVRALVVAAHLAPLGAIAMEHRIVGDQLILSGALDGNELVLLKDLEANRQLESIRTVVLRNSPGGNAWTAMRVGEFVRERGLRTAVSGYCFGGCAMVFLGGRERHFTNDRPERQTQINFTATYNSQDDALRMTKGTQNETMTEIGRGWLRKHSDGKLSEEMLDRIGRLQQN